MEIAVNFSIDAGVRKMKCKNCKIKIGYKEWENNDNLCNRCNDAQKPDEKIIVGGNYDERKRNEREVKRRSLLQWHRRVRKKESAPSNA